MAPFLYARVAGIERAGRFVLILRIARIRQESDSKAAGHFRQALAPDREEAAQESAQS